MIKKLSYISILVLLLAVILLLAPTCQCGQGAQQTATPPGPPQVASFKMASQFVGEDQAPVFIWEAANASSVTITQYGEVVYHIEAVPDTENGAFLMPQHDKAYASNTSEYETKQSYSPGIYPVGFKGASNGKPFYGSTQNKDFWTNRGNVYLCQWEGVADFGNKVWRDSHCTDISFEHHLVYSNPMLHGVVWQFGDSKEGEQKSIVTDAVMDIRSPDGQLATTKIPLAVVQEGDPLAPRSQPLITPPPCIKSSTSERVIPTILSWRLTGVADKITFGEAPQFEFEVTNAHIISIRHGDEYISSVEINNPPVTSSISLPSLSDKAHASTSSEYELKQPYSPGVYPVIYQGSSSGRPATIIWNPGEKSRDDSAEITVCSPSGDIVSATVTFTIMRVEEQAQQPPAACQPPVISFSASRNVVVAMDPVTLTWNVTGDNLTVRLVSNGVQRTVPPSGTDEMIILKSACYYITAESPCGRDSKSQCITVQTGGFMPQPEFIEPPCPTCPPPPPPPPPWVTDH